jgi:N utilization substance protein A
MDLKNFTSAMAQIAEEKGIPMEKIIDSIETAIAAAYKKDYGKKGQIIKAKLNPSTGELKFWQIKIAVTPDMLYTEEELEELKKQAKEHPEKAKNKEKEEEESKTEKVHFNPEKHIFLEEAKALKPDIKAGEELEIALETKTDYGRIAAQTAKQVILQKIREAERETVFGEYKSKEGEIVSGIVQRIEGKNVYINIGKTTGILPKEEQVQGEFYRPGQRLKVYLLKVEETPKGPIVFLSRAYPKFVSKLFELEVPEISQGTVVIKSIAREAGFRSKIAVESKEEGVDPIGSTVGQRGTRVMTVINELGGEKIDIIEYSAEPEKFISNSLSPAKVIEVKLLPKNRALCIVPEDQLSLAIGRDGQNVRLAAKLTGWKIDVITPTQEAEYHPEDEKKEKEPKEKEEKEKEPKEKQEKKVKKTKKVKKSKK